MEKQQRFRGCLLGLACGDAVGTTVEFCPRGRFPPVTDMAGGGPFQLPAGAWTDDTSMALCLATSLVERNGFDPRDQMQRYCDWRHKGYLSSIGRCFDVGNTVSDALYRFKTTGEPFSGSLSSQAAGNGCIMRLAPVPLFFYPDREATVRWAGESSRTTHGADECVDACRAFGLMLFRALAGQPKESVLFDPHALSEPLSAKIEAIAQGEYRNKPEADIESSGYVVDTLEAALWAFLRTDSFKDAILTVVNLGGDADSTGAVCGQIAGAYYGVSAIPGAWLEKLFMRSEICQLADRLANHPAEKTQRDIVDGLA